MKKLLIILLSIILILGIGGFILFNYFINNTTVTGILVEQLPIKTTYFENEELDLNGLIIVEVDSKGNREEISIDECNFSSFDSTKPNDVYPIIVTYKTFETRFYVTIKERPELLPNIVGIEISKLPNKLVYNIGEKLITDGGVLTIKYDNDTSTKILLNRSDVYGFDSSTPNDNLVLTVKYKEKGKIYTTTFSVVIKG